MAKPQETMEERFDFKFKSVYHPMIQSVNRLCDTNEIHQFIREEITRAIKAHDRELAKKVVNSPQTSGLIDTSERGTVILVDDVLALLTKQ